MSTPGDDGIGPEIEELESGRGDFTGWQLGIGLLVLFAAYAGMRGTFFLETPAAVARMLAMDLATMTAPAVVGWAIAAGIEAVGGRRRGRPTKMRRNVLTAVAVMTLVMLMGQGNGPNGWSRPGAGPVASAPTASDAIEEQAVARPSRSVTPLAQSAPEAPAGRAEATSTNTRDRRVTSWVDIARQPDYIDANDAQRVAIRDLYWRICIQPMIPAEQRASAYEMFFSDWEIAEAEVPKATARSRAVWEYLEEQRNGAQSPVSAGTMARWCKE